MAETNKISMPNEYNLNRLEIRSYNGFSLDIRDNIVELCIHESMYTPTISGQVMIGENVNLSKHFPIVGSETLLVDFETPSRKDKCQREFFVYKLGNRLDQSENAKMSMYTLSFASPEFVFNQQNKVSRGYKNMSYSDMVASLYQDSIMNKNDARPLFIEKTLGKHCLVIPYMPPLQAASFIASRAISNDGKDPTYHFYETFDGFHFKTINYNRKIQDTPIAEYFEFRSNISENNVIRDIEKEFRRISAITFLNGHNSLKNMADGVFSSVLILPNSIDKKIETKTFAYQRDFFKQTTLNPSRILPQTADYYSYNPYTHMRVYPKTPYLFSNVKYNEDYENVVLQRNAHLRHLDNMKIEILVPGDSERRVGDVVNVNIFSRESAKKNQTNIYDPYMSGNYVITQITHQIIKNGYTMRLFLERDSDPQPYPEEKEIYD